MPDGQGFGWISKKHAHELRRWVRGHVLLFLKFFGFGPLTVDIHRNREGLRFARRADNHQNGAEGRGHLSVPLKGEKQRLVIRHDKGFGFKGIARFICQQHVEPRIIRNRRKRAVCGSHRCGQADFGSLNRKPDFCTVYCFKAHKLCRIMVDLFNRRRHRKQIHAFARRIHRTSVEIKPYGRLIHVNADGEGVSLLCGFRQGVKIADGGKDVRVGSVLCFRPWAEVKPLVRVGVIGS